MGVQALTLEDVKGRSFEEVIRDIVAQESTVTVLLPDGKEVLIQPKPRLKPLPKLEGRLPEGRTRSMPQAEAAPLTVRVLIDAGVFIGALLTGDPRHAEARPLIEQARQGALRACTTAGILSEVYGALTWEKAEPR